MATENVLSGVLTNRDATPQVKINSALAGSMQTVVGTLESGTGDLASTYRMVQIPSNCRVDQVLLYCDDLGTTGLADIGIYQTTANGSAVVDADFFASAVDMKTAALNGVDVTHESAVYGLEDAEKPLWQALGLTADPGRMYDVVLTTTEAFQAAGTITLKVRYAI